MKFMEKVWGSLGLFESVEADDEQKLKSDDVSENGDQRGRKNSNVVNLTSVQKQMKVIVVEPFSFDDAQHVADHLKNRKPVVINFENTEREIAKRMVDFISGTTYALGGTIQKVGNHIFLCAPNNVDVAYSPNEELTNREFLPWNKE